MTSLSCGKLALNTSPHHECNPRGSQTGDVATVQWHCHLLLIGQPWGLASCHPENLHRPETVETELARELENQYSKMHLEIDQIQDSIHQSKKHHFFRTSFLRKSKWNPASTLVFGRLKFLLRRSHAPKRTWFSAKHLFHGNKISVCSTVKSSFR